MRKTNSVYRKSKQPQTHKKFKKIRKSRKSRTSRTSKKSHKKKRVLKKHKGGAAAETKDPTWLNETDSSILKDLVDIKTQEELTTKLTQVPYEYDTNNKTLNDKQNAALTTKNLKENDKLTYKQAAALTTESLNKNEKLKRRINTVLIPNLPAGENGWRARVESDPVPKILLEKIIIPILTKYKEHTIDDKGVLNINNIETIFKDNA